MVLLSVASEKVRVSGKSTVEWDAPMKCGFCKSVGELALAVPILYGWDCDQNSLQWNGGDDELSK